MLFSPLAAPGWSLVVWGLGATAIAGGCQGSLDRPAGSQSTTERVLAKTKLTHPGIRRLNSSVKGDGPKASVVHWVSPVPVLLNPCGPAAIAGLVVAVAVDAVERHPIGTLPHVLEEVVELGPPITNGDAPRPVSLERWVFGTGTARVHCSPAIPCRLVFAWHSLLRFSSGVERDGMNVEEPRRAGH